MCLVRVFDFDLCVADIDVPRGVCSRLRPYPHSRDIHIAAVLIQHPAQIPFQIFAVRAGDDGIVPAGDRLAVQLQPDALCIAFCVGHPIAHIELRLGRLGGFRFRRKRLRFGRFLRLRLCSRRFLWLLRLGRFRRLLRFRLYGRLGLLRSRFHLRFFSVGCCGSDAEDSAGGSGSSDTVGSAGTTSLISMPDVSSAVSSAFTCTVLDSDTGAVLPHPARLIQIVPARRTAYILVFVIVITSDYKNTDESRKVQREWRVF